MLRIEVLGIQLSVVNPKLAFEAIVQWVREHKKVYVCIAPASTLVDAQSNKEYKNVVNQAAMVTPDGVPVIWLAKFKGAKTIERTYGPDLMRLTCDLGQSLGLRHFFYGGTPKSLLQLQNCLKDKYPSIKIAGSYAPDFYPQAQRERDDIIQLINDSKADILWIGLGSPKQDFWMSIHRPLLNIPVIVGSGAAFDFISGAKSEAPRWMQNFALGWLFRLCCEPRRLWKRYLIGNFMFIFYAIKDLLKKGNR